jgi:hypothetical protein
VRQKSVIVHTCLYCFKNGPTMHVVGAFSTQYEKPTQIRTYSVHSQSSTKTYAKSHCGCILKPVQNNLRKITHCGCISQTSTNTYAKLHIVGEFSTKYKHLRIITNSMENHIFGPKPVQSPAQHGCTLKPVQSPTQYHTL